MYFFGGNLQILQKPIEDSSSILELSASDIFGRTAVRFILLEVRIYYHEKIDHDKKVDSKNSTNTTTTETTTTSGNKVTEKS